MKKGSEKFQERGEQAYLQLYAVRIDLYERKAPQIESLFLFVFEV